MRTDIHFGGFMSPSSLKKERAYIEMKSIIISEEAKKESREVINDLIKAAYNNAKENLKKKSSEELSNLTGGIQLPFNIKPPF